MIIINRAFCLIIGVFLGFGSVQANDQSEEITVSRYVTVSLTALEEQREPLTNVINLNLNRNARTVLDGIQQALLNSGYRLATNHPDRRVNQLFVLPLPDVHRTLGPITVSGALSTIAGKPWKLVIDPINRLITFQLPDTFKDAPLVYIKPVVVQAPIAPLSRSVVYVPLKTPVKFDKRKTLAKIKAKQVLTIDDIPEILQ